MDNLTEIYTLRLHVKTSSFQEEEVFQMYKDAYSILPGYVFDEESGDFENFFRIERRKFILSWVEYIILDVSFRWDLWEMWESWDFGEVIDEFLDSLSEKSDFLWRFEDSWLSEQSEFHYQNLRHLEDKLREVLAYIFLHRYPDENDFLKDIEKHERKYNEYSKDMSETQQSIFHYLDFWEYQWLWRIRKLNENELVKHLEKSTTFDDWSSGLLSRWIQDEKHLDFLASIEEHLWPVQQFRNIIMHWRHWKKWKSEKTKSTLQSYEQSIDKISSLIWDFWKNEPDT